MKRVNKGVPGLRAKKFLSLEYDASADGRWFSVSVPVHTESESNHRELHFIVARKAKEQRRVAAHALQFLTANTRITPALVRAVKLTRHGLRLMDCDNLPGAIKRVRDQVAAWIAGDNTIKGKGDDSPTCGVEWSYSQVTGKEYGVVIELRY